jgi:IS5 family transposase
VSDSLVLRQFCRVYAAPVPDETTLLRWANLLHPATLHRLLDHVVALARALKVTRGRTLRIDGTVVATHLHHPTDSTLLYDGVRVLSRTLAKATHMVQEATTLARTACRERTRRAKRQMKRIMEAARQRTGGIRRITIGLISRGGPCSRPNGLEASSRANRPKRARNCGAPWSTFSR